MDHQFAQADPPAHGQYYVQDDKSGPMSMSPQSSPNMDSKRWSSLVTQVSHLNERFSSLEQQSQKRHEELSNTTKLQLQLMTERVNNLESKYKLISHQLQMLLRQTETDPTAVSGAVKNKLETISKQMADLYDDITKFGDTQSNSGASRIQNTKQSLQTQRDVVLDLQSPSTVESSAALIHQLPNIGTVGSSQAIDSPVSLRGHPTASSKATRLSTSPSNLSTGQLALQDNPTPVEANLLDLKWNKQLGVTSPSVPSPFNPKLNLDYPYSMPRADSYQKQLMGQEYDPKRSSPDSIDKANQPLRSVAVFTEPSQKHATSAITPYELDPLTEFSGIITSERKKRKTKSSDSSLTSPSGILKHDTPQFKLEKNAKTVEEIWNEWEYGVNGKPPLKMLESKYSARWRNDTESRTFVRRKKIYLAIETGKARGFNEEDVIQELENSRAYVSNGTIKKKPLAWLYNNIPQKFQSD